jgi:hypothetical protein
MTDPDLEHPGVQIRLMRPATRRRSERPRWEVSAQGRVIGWVDENVIGGSSAVFYFVTAIHPENGREYRLENSTDFHDRVEVIRRFDLDPMTSRQHLGLGLMPAFQPRDR